MNSRVFEVVARFLRYVLLPDPVIEHAMADKDVVLASAELRTVLDSLPSDQRPRTGIHAAVALTTAASMGDDVFGPTFDGYLKDLPASAWPLATAVLAHELNMAHQVLNLINKEGLVPGQSELRSDALRAAFAARVNRLVEELT